MQTTPDSAIRCIDCLESLRPGDEVWECSGCGVEFPVTADGIPIFSRAALRSIASAYASIGEAVAGIDACEAELRGATWFPHARDEIREKLVNALAVNREFVAELAEGLPPRALETQHLSANELRTSTYESAAMVMDHARRDWSHDATAEVDIGRVVTAVSRALADVDRSELVVMLGAGTCRVAHEIGRAFPRLLAVDSSILMLRAYRSIVRRSAAYFDTDLRAFATPHGAVRELRLTAESDAPSSPPVQAIAADATDLPLDDDSVSAVVSAFFTDVVPLSKLLTEMKRVLKVGGLFVHVGPLAYHFDDLSERLSVPEVRDRFRRAGFEIIADEMLPDMHGVASRPNEFFPRMLGVWSFCARRLPAIEIVPSTILRVNPGTRVEGVTVFGASGAERAWTVTTPTGETLDVHDSVALVLQLLDGKKDLAVIAKSLSTVSAHPSFESLETLARELLSADAVSIV